MNKLYALTSSLILSLAFAINPVIASNNADPLKSVQWEVMKRTLLDDQPVVFDKRIRVLAPEAAENSLEVPVFFDASEIPDIKRILVFADLNPLPRVLEYFPGENVKATLGFRIKVQQATPIRVAVQTANNTWHVAGTWVDAAGGGCTLPSLASGDQAWATRLGEVSGRLWDRNQTQRARFSILHPMDTGLAPGIPAFHVSEVALRNAQGEVLARLMPYEPVSENPVFTMDIEGTGNFSIDGRDNNGNRFEAELVPSE